MPFLSSSRLWRISWQKCKSGLTVSRRNTFLVATLFDKVHMCTYSGPFVCSCRV